MKKYFKTTLRLWKLLKPFHKHFYIQLFLIVILQLLNIFSTVVLSKSIDSVVTKNFVFAAYFVVGFFLISLLRHLFNYLKEAISIKELTYNTLQFLQEYSFIKIFKLNASQYIEDHSAIKLQVINRGEDAVKTIVSTIFLNILPTATQVIFSIVAIGFYSIEVALISSISLAIVIFWTVKFTNYQRPLLKTNISNWDVQRKIRTEAFQHLSLIKVSGVEESYLKNYLKNRIKLIGDSVFIRQTTNKHSTKRWIFFGVTNLISRLILIYKVYLGQLAIGSIYAVWTWISEANNNIFSVVQAMREIPLRFVELEKYLDIIDKEPEFRESGSRKIETGNIVFSNLKFKYPKGEVNVIEKLNITIPTGKKVAFVGFSGSGKSTIIKLILRIYDWNSGDIKIGNQSLRDLDAQTLRQKIGYVEQHVDLFDTTIRENILFGIPNKKINEDYLNEIIHKARIDQFFHRLGSTGLDTIIGERGVKLSGGERQRIGIARALAKDPEILIFDKATASLDTENEKYIQEAIDESAKGRTTIIIAHRLSTIQNADIIFVMDKGKIVGTGTHEELKESCAEYQRLIHAQN